MNDCGAGVADRLLVGTVLGKDCDGNPVVAGDTIATCKNLNDITEKVEELEADNPVMNIDFSGEVPQIVYKDGTTKPLQIDTDQARISGNSTGLTLVNEDGSGFKVDASIFKSMIASDYVDNTELGNILRQIDYDQVTGFGVEGSNVTITNEDGSKVSISRTDLINLLNTGMATDEELANAIANIQTVKVTAGRNIEVETTTADGVTTHKIHGKNPVEFFEFFESTDSLANNNFCDRLTVINFGDETNSQIQEDLGLVNFGNKNGVLLNVGGTGDSFQIASLSDGDGTNRFIMRANKTGCNGGATAWTKWEYLATKTDNSKTVTATLLQTLINAGNGLHIGDLGQINVCISDAEGNLLEMRNGCLYYGEKAPADVANLYVDSVGGSDANDGTITAPLKSIEQVRVKLTETGSLNKSSTIHLKAGGTYDLSVLQAENNALRTITAYGDPLTPDGAKYAQLLSEGKAFNWWAFKELNRPIVNLSWDTTTYGGQTVQYVKGLKSVNNGSFLLEGVEIKMSPAPQDKTAVPLHPVKHNISFHSGEGKLTLKGVIVDDNGAEEDTHLITHTSSDAGSVSFTGVTWVKDGVANNAPRDGATKPAIFIPSSNLELAIQDYESNQSWVATDSTLTSIEPNMTEVVPSNRFIAPLRRDASGTVVNVSSDIVI